MDFDTVIDGDAALAASGMHLSMGALEDSEVHSPDSIASDITGTGTVDVDVELTAVPLEATAPEPSHVSDALRESLARNARSVSNKRPWEVGFAALIFGAPQQPRWFEVATGFRADPQTVQTPEVIMLPKAPVFPYAVRRLRTIAFTQSEDSMRLRAITRWRIVIEMDLQASSIGRILMNHCNSLNDEHIICASIQDVFANKSTATLAKRVSSVLRYADWLKESKPLEPFSFKEEFLYAYACHLRDTKAPPTTAESFRQAVSFSAHVLGFDVAIAAAASPRFTGACHAMHLLKPVTKQSVSLTVTEVQLLEALASGAPNPIDRVFAGHMCFAFYSCARMSDTMWLSSLDVDLDCEGTGFIEGRTRLHKTSTTKQRRALLLPLAAPVLGVSSKPWGPAWLKARRDAGLKIEAKVPTLAPFGLNGQWCSRRLTTSEATIALRDLLSHAGVSKERVAELTAHSLKSTPLAWAAKYPLSTEHRRMLGHHHAPGLDSVLTYSRDAMAAPLEAFNLMLEAIRDGWFQPDASRANRAYARAQQPMSRSHALLPRPSVGSLQVVALDSPEPEKPEEVAAEVDGSEGGVISSSDSGSSSSDSCSDVDDLELEAEQARRHRPVVRPALELPADVRLFQHCGSGVIHCAGATAEKLKCGRAFHASYSRFLTTDYLEWPVCRQCMPV